MVKVLDTVLGALVLVFSCVYICPSVFADPCNGRADIVFLVPAGARTYNTTFEDNLITLMTYFNIAEDQIHIGLQLYGDETYTLLDPADFKNRKQVNTYITLLSRRQLYENQVEPTGQNYTKALKAMKNLLDNSPAGVTRMGVILTEGVTSATKNDSERVLAAAQDLKDAGVIVYNLGSQFSSFNGLEFQTVGYDFCRLFSLGTFEGSLPFAFPDLAKGICSELDPAVNVPSSGALGNCFPQSYDVTPPYDFSCPKITKDFRDPNNCAYFYRCVAGFPEPTRMACSDGTIFNSSFENGEFNHYCIATATEPCFSQNNFHWADHETEE